MARFESTDGRLTITAEDASGEYDHQELLTAAIVSLIDSADTHHWEKRALEHGEADPTPGFYEAVLTAVATHRAVDDDRLEGKPVYEALLQLIEDLRADGHLQEPVVFPDDDDE